MCVLTKRLPECHPVHPGYLSVAGPDDTIQYPLCHDGKKEGEKEAMMAERP